MLIVIVSRPKQTHIYIPAQAADRCLIRDAVGGVVAAYRSAAVRRRLVCFYPACIVEQWLVLRWLTTGRRFRSSSRNEVFVDASRPLLATIPSCRERPVSPGCIRHCDDASRFVIAVGHAVRIIVAARRRDRQPRVQSAWKLFAEKSREPDFLRNLPCNTRWHSSEARDTSAKSHRPSAVAVIAVVRSLIRHIPANTRLTAHNFTVVRSIGWSIGWSNRIDSDQPNGIA